jgi:hypothetical protein
MRTTVAMSRLRAANPVTEAPAVAPASEMLDRVQAERPAAPSRGAKKPRRFLAGALVAGAVAVGAVLLSLGASGPAPNIAAAAFAATSPEAGVLHAVFETRGASGGRAVFRQEQWIDQATGKERELVTFGSQTTERITGSEFAESWSSEAPDTIYTERRPTSKFAFAFDGLTLSGLNGVALFRQLYRSGRIKLVGRARHAGQSLWRLESNGLGFGKRTRRLVLLLDPHTFLPTVQAIEDISNPKHPRIVSESRLVSYGHLAGRIARNLDVRARHPNARVLPPSSPLFRSGRAAETEHPGP